MATAAAAFVESLISDSSTASFPIGAADWIPGGVQYTGADFASPKRFRTSLPGPFSSSAEGGIRDAQPNGRVHVTYAIQITGREFKAEHLGLGELLFVYYTDTELPWALQTSRIVTYSELNRRLGQDIELFRILKSREGKSLTAKQLFDYAVMRARLWKFIGAQPTERNEGAQSSDFAHMVVAASHFCNIKNVFLADTVVEAGDLLYLCICPPDVSFARNDIDHGEGSDYAKNLQNICLRPFVSKFRSRPPICAHSIYIGMASLMYGTQFDERDPYRIQTQAKNAISRRDRNKQREILDAMPTLDVFLLR